MQNFTVHRYFMILYDDGFPKPLKLIDGFGHFGSFPTLGTRRLAIEVNRFFFLIRGKNVLFLIYL